MDFGNFDSKDGLFARLELSYDLEDTFDVLKLLSGSGQGSLPYKVLSGEARHEIFFVPVDAISGLASLHLITDKQGRRRGFHAEVSAEYVTDLSPTCEVGRFGSQCESMYCLSQNTFHQSERGFRVTSQDKRSFLPSMPWSPEGGCVWQLAPSAGAVRLRIKEFDLEPYPADVVGDKIIIYSDDGQGTALFIESCETSDTCNFIWQDGTCINGERNRNL